MADEKNQELEKPDNSITKSEVKGFLGGVDVRLNKVLSSGDVLIDKLTADIDKWLSQAIEEQAGYIENLSKWERQYHGEKEEKTFPYAKCSNVAIPITRSSTDAIHVRTIDRIFNRFKVFLIKAKRAELVDVAPLVEEALEWWAKYSKFKQKLLSPLLESIMTGTGIVKIPWVRKTRAAVRYATDNEIENQKDEIFKLPGGRYGIKAIQTIYEGPDIEGIPRKDWVISPEAKSIEDAFLVGFRTYLRKPDVQLRVKQGLYYKSILEKLKSPDEYDESEKEKAESEGKELRVEYKEPFEFWELWFKYDVDEDGEPDDIVVVYHKESKTIARAIYNPFFHGFRPFVAFKGFLKKYRFDGEGVGKVLGSLAEAIDSINNQRIDRLTQINNPIVLLRSDAGITDFSRAPGKPTIVDGDIDNVIRIIPEPTVAPATFNEESMLVRYSQEAVGITPQVLGQPTAERPVAKETLALIQEANKKFLAISDGAIDSITEIGWKVLEEISQHSPTYRYYSEQEGQLIEKTIDFPSEYLRDAFELELAASKEMMSQEARRDVNIAIYQLLSDAATKLFGMVQAIVSGQMPSAMIEYVMRWIVITEKLLERILTDFNQADSKNLVAKAEDLDLVGAMQEMQQKIQQMQMAQAQLQQAQGIQPQAQQGIGQ